MLRLGDSLREPAYTDFVKKNIAFNFDSYAYFQKKYANEGKWNYPFGQFFTMEELDDYGAMGAGVIELLRLDPQVRYREYINKAADYAITRQNRLDDRTFVRSFPKRWTLWADDLYMSVVFLSRMGILTGENRYFDDAALQVINFHKHLFDASKGLMHHDWYSEGERQGVAFWGRANGWALLAQVDLLDRLPEHHPRRQELLALLKRHLMGVARYQSTMGLWHQLLDRDDSYLETSCSAMFTYALARAVNSKYIEPQYASVAKRGWEGVMCRIQPDGKIAGVCTGTGVSEDLAFYYQRPTPLNDAHGIGAVLLAGTEIMALPE
jgi:rhamnogalacturonyl hydrolase YesR